MKVPDDESGIVEVYVRRCRREVESGQAPEAENDNDTDRP